MTLCENDQFMLEGGVMQSRYRLLREFVDRLVLATVLFSVLGLTAPDLAVVYAEDDEDTIAPEITLLGRSNVPRLESYLY